MILDSFGFHIPSWFSPVITTAIVGFFFYKSQKEINLNKAVSTVTKKKKK